VKYVRRYLPHVYNIDPMYTDIYEKNLEYKNTLSIKEFIHWNSSNAIDILIKNRFPITWFIPSSLQLCSAYQPYSCKIYSDGYIGLCDSMPYSKDIHIKDLAQQVDILEKIFTKFKNYNPLNDDKCGTCKYLIQCQGELLCKTNSCEYQKRFDEIVFLKTCIKHLYKNSGKFFVRMFYE
jgi:radical SAM protein with 4Fe4S-binding SPASM domain